MANQAPAPKNSPQNPKKVTNEEKRNDQATKRIVRDSYDVIQEGDTKEPIVNIKRTEAIEPAVLIGRDGIPSQDELEAAAAKGSKLPEQKAEKTKLGEDDYEMVGKEGK